MNARDKKIIDKFVKCIETKKYQPPHTLPPECVGVNESGWKIKGEIHKDYYEYVTEFEAKHSKYGKVWGDFETEVYADSEEGYKNFIENHPPEGWEK